MPALVFSKLSFFLYERVLFAQSTDRFYRSGGNRRVKLTEKRNYIMPYLIAGIII